LQGFALKSNPPQLQSVGDTGFEHLAPNPSKTVIPDSDGAKCGALGAQLALNDPDLAELIRCWADLSEAVRACVLALVRAAEGAR